MFGAGPGGDDSFGGEAQVERGVLTDEGSCEGGLFIEVGGFAELCVTASFFEAGDALATADGVWVKDVVVADPEFEGKIGAKRDGAMELRKVADGPRRAEEKDEREG